MMARCVLYELVKVLQVQQVLLLLVFGVAFLLLVAADHAADDGAEAVFTAVGRLIIEVSAELAIVAEYDGAAEPGPD